MKDEKTFVLLKPDAVARGLIGQCLLRLEDHGLRVIRMQMLRVGSSVAAEHYPRDEEWLAGLGRRVLVALNGEFPEPLHGCATDSEIGKRVREWLSDFLQSGPVVALDLTGPHAIVITRRAIGAGHLPPKGTIRGDLGRDTVPEAMRAGRALRNLVHASDSEAEALRESALWLSA